MNFRNEWEFRVIGLKRSGNHAIILWLANHFSPQTVYFINDVTPLVNPFIRHANSSATTCLSESFVRRAEEHIANEQMLQKHCLMCSYEDRPLASLVSECIGMERLQSVGSSVHEINLLILRDPFNMLASRIKSGFSKTAAQLDYCLEIWCQYAREFCGETNFLRPNLTISYNRWFVDQDYRRSISNQLGLRFTDSGIDRVPENGKGSSWDGTRLDYRAQEMKVLDRWQPLVQDITIRRLFQRRPEIFALSEGIFGHMAGTDEFFCSKTITGRIKGGRRGFSKEETPDTATPYPLTAR